LQQKAKKKSFKILEQKEVEPLRTKWLLPKTNPNQDEPKWALFYPARLDNDEKFKKWQKLLLKNLLTKPSRLKSYHIFLSAHYKVEKESTKLSR
jgi:hypothetical protein